MLEASIAKIELEIEKEVNILENKRILKINWPKIKESK